MEDVARYEMANTGNVLHEERMDGKNIDGELGKRIVKIQVNNI